MDMDEQDDTRQRLAALEAEMELLREQVSNARTLAAMADRDSADSRTSLRAHTQVLGALRESQLEQGQAITGLAHAVGVLVAGQAAHGRTLESLAEGQAAHSRTLEILATGQRENTAVLLGHSEVLAHHGTVLAENGRILAEHSTALAEQSTVLRALTGEVGAIRTEQATMAVGQTEILAELSRIRGPQ